MKREWLIGLLVAIAGILTGVWLGKPASVEVAPMAETKTERVGGRSLLGKASDGGTDRTFAALVRQLVQAEGIPSAAYRSIERASTEELREMLLKISAEELRGRPYEAGLVKRRASLNAAAAELYRREGVVCLEWALELEKADLSLAVMTAAAEKDPAVMKEWLVKFGGHWESWSGSSAVAAAERGAAMRNAEDLLAVETLFSGSLNSDFAAFADGFDFRAYLKGTQGPSGGEKAYRFWAAQDPEAAAQGLREGLGTNPYNEPGRHFRPAMEGRAEMTSDTEAAEWICGIVNDLTGETRTGAIRGLAGREGATKQSLALMQHLPTDDDRVNFAAASLRGFSMDPATPLLEALPSQAMQAEALGRWVQGLNAGLRNSAAGMLDQMMERLKFPDDQRQLLRAKLPQSP